MLCNKKWMSLSKTSSLLLIVIEIWQLCTRRAPTSLTSCAVPHPEVHSSKTRLAYRSYHLLWRQMRTGESSDAPLFCCDWVQWVFYRLCVIKDNPKTGHCNLSHRAAVWRRGCHLAGSTLSGLKSVSLIEIAELGCGPLNPSYKWHVSPVSYTPHSPNEWAVSKVAL